MNHVCRVLTLAAALLLAGVVGNAEAQTGSPVKLVLQITAKLS